MRCSTSSSSSPWSEVHRYEGTINQFLGDGFMALFGAPIAHEDHARRAVLAAVGIRQRLHAATTPWGSQHGVEVAVRMGLNTGLVIVGAIGDNLRMDYTAVGDTTNVAARLQQAAVPGQIRHLRDDASPGGGLLYHATAWRPRPQGQGRAHARLGGAGGRRNAHAAGGGSRARPDPLHRP